MGGLHSDEEGLVFSSEALRRSCCDCRLQIVAHDEGTPRR